jgi:hypothetical protein
MLFEVAQDGLRQLHRSSSRAVHVNPDFLGAWLKTITQE